ncbi:hypothetical protein CHS0354_020934 [Potamilus streckersoni]|uniref:CRAL-TRIO domain-containing protein n=1 Tax=Potamilus streckersoni TaxID=2493646 RepID=A0AAE0W0G6_9BIVA|nr:hypothetical protein CHS0354_020934 [Potamilus streckersoni]
MDEYLTYTKRRLGELETVDRVHVVLGNEACDLDSAVAALTYAFYLHHKSVKDTGVLYLPVLNITSDQYRLRTETVYFLGRLNIKQTDLTFRDNIDLQTLKVTGKLDLTLVDHNVLVVHDQSLEDLVTTVIDHRPRDRQEQAGVRVVIELVGSCCTLIAEELLSDPEFNLNHQVALLLYGTILTDTVNRSVAAGKLTQRDEAVLQRLEGILQDVNGQQLYEDIQIAKCDLSGLTTMEILEKDMKMVHGTSMTVAMSSVAVDMQELLSRECFTSDLETFCQQKGCPVIVIMSITAVDEDNIYRQLAVFSTNRIFREQICDVLDLSINPNLQLEPVKTSLENISIFRQGNVKASRKKVLPVIKAFLNGDKTPDITSKEFASETQQAAAKVTEGFSSFSNLDTSTTSMQNQSEELFFTGSDETHKQLFSKDDFNPFGAMNSDDIPVKESQSRNLIAEGFDPFATSSMQNQSEEDSYFTVSNETQFSDAEYDPFGAVNNDDIPIKDECDKNLVDMQRFDPFKTISNSESNEWQSGSEICSLDPWNSNGMSESVLTETGSDLQFFDTFIHPVQGQSGSAAEHHAASDSTSVQSKVQMDDFELMTPESVNEEAVTQSDVDLGYLNQDNSASDQNLSANTNHPLLEFGPFFEGESSGEDLKNSWPNPVFTSQVVSFADSAQLSPLQSVNVSDPFKDKSSDNLKFDQYSKESFAAQDGREKYESVFDSLELNEADLFDQINTPDYQSGVSTPLINSGISTPFDSLHVNHSGRNSESESGYPTITQTPPHSFTESGMANLDKDHVLPSFNSSEMVERIHRKKASLHEAIEINFNTNSVPYTPQNSFIEGTFDAAMIDRDLPSFDNSEFLQKIQEKRSSLAGIHEGDADSKVSQYPYAPHNSLIDATFDKYAQENLSSMNDADAVESVREKQAALAFLTGSDMNNLSTQNENPSLGSVKSNNPFLENIESEASSSINPFLFMDDSVLTMEKFMSPFTPQNSFSESNLPLMANRDSSIKTETHSRKLLSIMDNENFKNVAAQNPSFMNIEENLDSMQKETEEIKNDVCETGSLDNNFKEQEGQGEHEQREISFKEEENNDSQLFKNDLFYIERGKEVLSSSFKSVVNASILAEDDVRLSEISNSWGQDIQQQDIVDDDNLDSANIQSPSGKSKTDGLDRECQIIESSIAHTEASSDNEEELENECDTRSEEDLLRSREMEEIQEIAYSVAGEIIQTVLDNFPDFHIPNVAKTLQVVESISLEKGSEVPITEVPNKSEGESIFSLETEYLPNMDPLGGNMDLVTSPSFSAQDKDNEFGDVETVSFHRASHEECHGDSLHEGDTSHSVTLLSAQVLENETPVFVPDKLGSDLVSNQQVVSGDMTSLFHATAVNLECNEKVNDNQLVVNIGQAKALETEKQNSDSNEPDFDVVLPEACNVSYLIDGPSFVPETNIEVAQLLESQRQNLVTQQLDIESVSHQPDSDWISFKPSSDLLLCKPDSEVVLSLSDDAGDGFASSRLIPVDQSVGTGLKNVPQDDYEAGEQYSFPDGSDLESFRNDLIANEIEVSVETEKFPSEMESVMNEKMLDLAGNIVNSVLASAIECTMGERMKTNVKTHVVSEESIDFSPVSTSLEDDVIEFASETEIDHVETVLETEISQIGRSGDRKIFHIESTFETDIPDIEIQCEKETCHSIQATKEDRIQADGEGRHDSSDSEDSDTSSTTTEGSYRIEDPGATYPPEMLYETMHTIENSDFGQETPANCLLAEEVIEKVDIPDLAVSKGYTYISKMDESKQMDYVLKDISGASDSVSDTEDKYAVTEIVENRDLLENQDYFSLIDLDIPHTDISSADSQTGTGVKEIWELQDQSGHIVEPYVRQTAEKDEKVQTWKGYEESVADTQNNNNSALVVDVKQDKNECFSAYHTAETSKEEETVPDLMTLVVHKKGKLKGGYSLDLPIPFVIIQEAADDLPSEEESPSPPSASTTGKKTSDTADYAMQKNKRTATETDTDECESLGDIALTDSVSHESELTGRKQAEDDAFLSKADSTTGLKSQCADNTHIKTILEEVLENATEEEHRLQEVIVGKESVCLKMSASEVDAGSFDENRLDKDTEIQEKSFATDSTSEVFEQSYATEVDTISAVGENLDEDEIVADFRSAKDFDAFKSQSAEIAIYSTDTDFESSSAFTDFKPAVEFDSFQMQPSYNAAKNYSEHLEKSYPAAAETMSSEENTVNEDITVADLKTAEEFDDFKSQSTEITVDSTGTDFENSFAFTDFKPGVEFVASKMQSSCNAAGNTNEHFEKSYAAKGTMLAEADKMCKNNAVADFKSAEDFEKSNATEAETMFVEENKVDEHNAAFKPTEDLDAKRHLTEITVDSTSKDSENEKSSVANVLIQSTQENKMDEDDTEEESDAFKRQTAETAVYSTGTDFEDYFAFADFKPAEELDASKMQSSYNAAENTDEHFEKSYAAAEETMPGEENKMNTDADFKSAEDFDAFKSQSAGNAAFSTYTDFENSFAFAEYKSGKEFDASKMQPSYNAAESSNEQFEKSYAAEAETMSSKEYTMDEGSTVADLKPAEEFDVFKSQSTEITVDSTGTDYENSCAFADFKPGVEIDASKIQSSYNAVENTDEHFEKSYAAEAETMFVEENNVDEDNTVADFKPTDDINTFKSQSTEITVDSTGTDFENSFAFADFKPAEDLDASQMQSCYNAAENINEQFEKSYAVEEETVPGEENKVDEVNTVADFKSAEDFDAFKSQSAEIAAYSTGTDFKNSFAFAEFKSGEEFDSFRMTPSYHASGCASEDFEKSYAAETETMSSKVNTVDEGSTVADLKPAEEFDVFKSQSTEITVDSTCTDFEKSVTFADFKFGEELEASKLQSSCNALESTSEHFEKSYAAEAETMFVEENNVDEDSTVADFKPTDDLNAFKSQSTEITVDSTGTDFENSFAFADFKTAEDLDASKLQTSYNAAENTDEHFEKSYAAEEETMPGEENKMDEVNTVADFKSAEDFDAFKSHSAENAAFSTYTDFENSFAFAEYKSVKAFDASKMQPSYNAAESSNEQFEKSYAAEAETMSSKEYTMDEDITVADLKPTSDNVTESSSENFEKSFADEVETQFAEKTKMEEDNTVADFKPAGEFDVFKNQMTDITADKVGTDFKISSVAEVESKLQEENKVNDGTSTDFDKSAAETENKSSLEEKVIEDITIIDLKPAQECDSSKSKSTEDKAENTSGDHKSLERLPVSDIDNRSSVLLRKEVYMTTAGRMSINIDSTYGNMIPEQKEDEEKMTSSMQYSGVSTVLEELQVEQIIQDADSLVADVDKTLASSDQSCGSSSIHELMATSLQPTEPKDKSLKEVENEKRHKRKTSVTSLGSKEKMRGMDWTEEFYEDPIPGMEAEEVCDSSDDSQVGSSDSEEDDSKPGRPNLLFDEGKGKKRIAADANILNKAESADDLLDDPPTPDDLGDGSGELEWEKRTKLQESQAKTDDTPVTSPSEPLSSQYSARDDDDDEDKADNDKNQFRKVEIAGKEHRVDMGVIEPYKKVLSHGGYYGDGLNAIILFSGCYLPDRSRRDYQYVMDNLFLYVISTLELLVAEDYMIVYFHGATPRRQMPSFGWLKKCYQTIDRRLKKNLKTLLLVHPTLWLKTVVMMTKPFISSKFSSKLRFVKTLRELATIIPMEYIYVPEPVQLYDDKLRNSTSISTPSSSSSDTTTPR